MINIRSILKLGHNDGLTLKNGKPIEYKSGWQVADYGVETSFPREVIEIVKRMHGNCGIWFADGVYYVDHSFRVDTKREAIEIGRKHSQISVFGWKRKNLAYCE